jgi:putative transposase
LTGPDDSYALLLVRDLLPFVGLACSSQTSLAAENLFLRKQLAFYVERKVKPRRLNHAARIALVVLARLVDWRQLLVVVQPQTLVRWHRQGSACCGGGSHGAPAVHQFRSICGT